MSQYGKAQPLRPRPEPVPLSDMPFTLGAVVVEKVGEDRDRPGEMVEIVGIDGDLCLTSTGRWYNRHDGSAQPKLPGQYRGLHSIGFERRAP